MLSILVPPSPPRPPSQYQNHLSSQLNQLKLETSSIEIKNIYYAKFIII